MEAINMGSMQKEQIEEYFDKVDNALGYGYTLKWSDDAPHCWRQKKEIELNRELIGRYPWECKEMVLHEFAHVSNDDNFHNEIFYKQYRELLKEFIMVDVTPSAANSTLKGDER